MNLIKRMTPAVLLFAIAACGNGRLSSPSNNNAVASQSLGQLQATDTTAAQNGSSTTGMRVYPTLTPPTDTGAEANTTASVPDANKAVVISDANARPVPNAGPAVACVVNPTATSSILGLTSQKLVDTAGVVLTSTRLPTGAAMPMAVGAALVNDDDGSILAQKTGLLTSQGLRVEFAPQVPLVDANGMLPARYTLYAWTVDANGDTQVFVQPLAMLLLTGNGAPAASRGFVMDPYDKTMAGIVALVDMAFMPTASGFPTGLSKVVSADVADLTLCVVGIPGAGLGSSANFYAPRSMRIIDATDGLEIYNDIVSPELSVNGVCSSSIQLSQILPVGHSFEVEIFSQAGDNMYQGSGGSAIDDFTPLQLDDVHGSVVVYSFLGNGAPFLSSY